LGEGIGIARLTRTAADLAVVAAGCAGAWDIAAGKEEREEGVVGESY